ncbi:P-loop containing nucleoside triphosphate hydrolase protein [Phellopilus nigrolimitatus]|nr:P-loop containing nucleoside triphosphate hydrolase protein [Phellopilus nigrolimitatus]
MDAAALWDITDPLTLDARKHMQYLLELIPQDSPFVDVFLKVHSGNTLLSTLSCYMLQPSLTLAIAWSFRPLLMDLCARWLEDDGELYAKLEGLAMLIEVHEELYPILSLFLRQKHFEDGPLSHVLNNYPIEQLDERLLHRILLAYYRILSATPSLPKSLNWDLSFLLKLCTIPHPDRGVCWLAIRCYALQSEMNERNRENAERSLLGEIGIEDCLIHYGEDISGSVKDVDGWMLPMLEVKRIQDYRIRILNSTEYFSKSGAGSGVAFEHQDLSPRIVNAHGILLLRTPSSQTLASTLVLTSPALVSIRKIAVNISLRRPTLLSSSPSSGKAAFLDHLALLLYPSKANHIVTIHLADTSLDPRSLLGSYVSSSTHAGSFEWKDGVLVKAMREGKWVVFKDIDRASTEVLGLIGPLVESMDDCKPIGSNALLSVVNRGSVEAAESFSLFATRSVEGHGAAGFPPPSFLGAQKWREVMIPDNTLDDLQLIVDSKFPKIAGPVADCLIDIWQTVKRLRSLSSTRPVGIRDLEKFCRRVSGLLETHHAIPSHRRSSFESVFTLVMLLPHPSLREDIYLEARDVFFAAGATNKTSEDQRSAIAMTIGEKLGLSEETCDWVLKRRTPPFEIEKDVDGRPIALKFGRTSLVVNSVISISDLPPSRSFSMHKQAVRLISQLAACVLTVEPVLLTGETGTGKTSVISHLATLLGRPLVSLNLSNQTESADLIGGFRPVSARIPALELQQRFFDLFQKTFSNKRNEKFHQSLRKAVADARWKTSVKLWNEASKLAVNRLQEKVAEENAATSDSLDSPLPRKRRKLQSHKWKIYEAEWAVFEADVRHFEVQHVLDKGKFAFHYVEGPLVKAIRTGAWQINLASSETLECISSLLQGPNASVTLTEQGSLEPVPRHHDFRLFACMNPATDVGKKDLSRNIRAKFTEIDVPSPDEDQEALISIISHYIGHLTVTDKSAIFDVAQFYTSVKRLSELGKIADGSDRRPHYSMRSLSRALIFAADTVQSFGLRRALWEGFTMAFTMVLNQASADAVLDLARRTLLSGVKNTTHFLSHLSKPPQATSIDSPVQLGPFWLSSGPNEREDVTDYILTPSVQKKLVDLARIIMIKRFPILIEGPTSSGKTSAIQYLARRTGHSFIRINNHEHTDIQEYLGSYASDPKTGKLVFRDGLLVRALRRGDWVVLDELNLAPTDVLEALNRLLDDNRELVIPETQEVVRPHPHFMLFATQNPPGVYAGRKVLSRALRNRFLEVHFDDVPQTELEHILCQKSLIAPSYSQRIVAVFHELQKRRQMGRIFEGKEGFATLRDLFRWAGRDAQGYQELAENGYMLLAERVRHEEDKNVVKEVIEKAMNVTVSEDTLYNLTSVDSSVTSRDGIVWTRPMQRLFILLSRALRFNEPVLLVGETGSGKTSMCQIYAATKRQILRTVNCHQNTEASDIIGGLRPVRQESSLESAVVREALEQLNADDIVDIRDKSQIISAISARLSTDVSPHERNILATAQRALSSNPGLLEWQDGPLVTCMRSADVFLLDEISLADDSVLERLNSVLEPSRTLVLAERGGEKVDDFQVVAKNGFNFVATMNPGGDFGKKELSPALRNRFTEIWVPSTMKRDDLYEIVKHSWKHDTLVQLTGALLDFVDWIVLEVKDTSILTLRDILSWVKFCNTMCPSSDLPPAHLFVHGGQMAVIDGLSSLTQLSSWSTTSLQALRQRATQRLEELSPGYLITKGISSPETSASSGAFHIGPFSVPLGSLLTHQRSFNFKAPTSLDNAFRLIRACQISKPTILEGSPGVGKTSLVSALAAAAGQRLCRINLSEQTDLVDLFGSDLPVDGDAAGKFAWRDADFLQALKNGHWVLLDEMNLASQSVLEGLNAVFDHRGTVFIPELDRSFSRHPNFRVFAAQNPLNQGSGRKGLPKSFLNRFTKVFVEQLSASDLLLICRHLFPSIPVSTLQLMIDFNCRLHDEVVVKQEYGILGSPWEFNLRDIIRWASLMERADGAVEEPWKYLNTIYRARFRCESDRLCFLSLFATVFGDVDTESKFQPRLVSTPDFSVCGSSVIYKGDTTNACHGARLRTSQLNALDAALSSISRAWLLIITGPQGVGKTSFVRSLASVAAQPLQELSLGSSSDTSDLIGSYEQIDNDYHFHHLSLCLLQFIDVCITRINSTYNSSLEWLLKLKKDALGTFQSRSLGALADIARATITATPSDGSLRHLKTLVEAALVSSQRTEACGPRFEWIDGPLVRALKTGEWLLLDNANLCSPSVLDRLNSLCEIEGSLILTEKGVDQQTIIPHRNFRLIMTVDPYRGEISRAMRNRGIEIALDTSNIQHDMGSLLDAQRLPPNAALVRSPAPHLRSVFELNRRMLLPSFSGLSDKSSLPCSTILVYNDSLASQMNDYRTVITESDSSTHDALVFLLFGSSTVVYPRHFLRLLKSLEMPQRLSEDLSFLLKGTESLNTSIGELTDLIQTKSEYWTNARGHMPNQPYLATSFINWSSENDLEVCKLTSNLLEAYALVTILEYRLQLQEDSMSVDIAESDRLSCGSTSFAEHEEVKTFLISMPTIVQKTLLYSYSKKDDIMQCSELALKLVHHSQHLHRAACQRIVNYSELYAVSGWIYDCIKGAPLPIHALEDQATALRRAFTLTSGQSLLELWNSFYRPKHSSEVDEIIQKLGSLTLDSRLDHGRHN